MSGEEFRAKLRRLRREPAPPGGDGAEPAAPEGATPPGLPAWLRTRLDAARERPSAAAPAPRGEAAGPSAATTRGAPEELATYAGPAGEVAARFTLLPRDHRHGAFRLDEIEHADPADFALLTGDEALAELELSSAVYLDTETTGLSGGAGTYVFQIGLGRFDGGRFELWQGFLREPGEERELLAECAERLRTASGVVSFFGKSFDRHRLEDKMRLVGIDPPFAGLPHLDLYHPCRRLYREALEDGRLATMERELCGVAREDDLSGAHAPAAWFDFLAERPHRLEAIFRHNRDDVLSLVTLAAHLGRTSVEERADGVALPGDPGARAAGLARSHEARGAKRAALSWLERALERGGVDRRELGVRRANLLRLVGEPEAAMEAYQALVGEPEDRYTTPALLEMAKVLEHRFKDRAAALECCELGGRMLERHHVGREYARLKADLVKRMMRLKGEGSNGS